MIGVLQSAHKALAATRRAQRDVGRALTKTGQYLSSYVRSLTAHETFSSVRTFCMFIGYPRSGHSLVGSMIDAHPRAIVAHELNVLHYLRIGFSRRQIFLLLLENSRRFAQTGRQWTGYSYAVPNQWQGRYATLEVLGDKKGGGTSKQFRADPTLLDRLIQTVQLPVRFVHVTRNPFDNISTIARRNHWALEKAIPVYFGLCAFNAGLMAQLGPETIHDMRYEAVVAAPVEHLTDLALFLGLEPYDDWVRDCASIVFSSPRKSREAAPWTPVLIADVQRRIDELPMLAGYTYDD